MELYKKVDAVLDNLNKQTPGEQTRRIDGATKMFDDLVNKGLIDAPSYRLAPTTAVPSRTSGLSKTK